MSDKIKIDLIFQVSICVNDMEAVMKNFRELFDIDESTLIKRCTKDFYDRGEFDGARYLGKHCEFYIKYYRKPIFRFSDPEWWKEWNSSYRM